MASSKRSSEAFFTKESRENAVLHEPQQVCTIVRNGECINIIFIFLEHFTWLCENFTWSCETAFYFSLSVLQSKPILFHFAWLCENSAWSCEMKKHAFSTPLCNLSHFFIFNPPPPPSIQLQSLVLVHFLFLIILIVYPPPFHFPFVTPCFKNHLRISPKLNKKALVSLASVAIYYLGIFGIITTQNLWNSWELVSKMCCFWVVINKIVTKFVLWIWNIDLVLVDLYYLGVLLDLLLFSLILWVILIESCLKLTFYFILF